MLAFLRHNRHSLGLIGAALVLFAALAPAMTRATASADGNSAALFCTTVGLVSLDAGNTDLPEQDEGKDAPGEHCPLCRLQDQLPVLPDAQPCSGWSSLAASTLYPRVPVIAKRTAHWSLPPSHGPPALPIAQV
jgi:hypothetical protein